jgi:hypothetical protein
LEIITCKSVDDHFRHDSITVFTPFAGCYNDCLSANVPALKAYNFADPSSDSIISSKAPGLF